LKVEYQKEEKKVKKATKKKLTYKKLFAMTD
jgi:hypothetical protein